MKCVLSGFLYLPVRLSCLIEADRESSVVQIRFETDSSNLKPLEDRMYVGSGRFIVEENQPIVVEYKISEVGAQCGELPKTE